MPLYNDPEALEAKSLYAKLSDDDLTRLACALEDDGGNAKTFQTTLFALERLKLIAVELARRCKAERAKTDRAERRIRLTSEVKAEGVNQR